VTEQGTRALICDFGGVLTNPLVEALTAAHGRFGVTLEDVGDAMARIGQREGRNPLFEVEKGLLSEAEFVRRLESELGDEVTLGSFRETYFDHLHPNGRMVDYMRSLKSRGLRMALLTNNIREWEPHWRAKVPEIDEIFDVVVDSSRVGMRKPEPEIYELTLERLGDGLTAQECIFVDDVELNCQTARELGMHAVLFDDTEQAITELERLLG
jgi:putative hydrolase of the HAD superfamily